VTDLFLEQLSTVDPSAAAGCLLYDSLLLAIWWLQYWSWRLLGLQFLVLLLRK